MLTALGLTVLTPDQRKEKIYAEVPRFNQINDDIEKSRALSQVINSFVDDYFNLADCDGRDEYAKKARSHIFLEIPIPDFIETRGRPVKIL